jgi:hypothetical protein
MEVRLEREAWETSGVKLYFSPASIRAATSMETNDAIHNEPSGCAGEHDPRRSGVR